MKKMNKKSGIANRDLIILISIAVVIIVAIIVVVIVVNSNKPNENANVNNNTPNVNAPVSTESSSKDNVEVSSDGTKINNSKKLAENKTFEGLVIKNISLHSNAGQTTFTATVENNTGADVAGKPINIVFLDKSGAEIKVLNTYLGSVKNGKTNTINAGSTIDLSNAYDFVVKNK